MRKVGRVTLPWAHDAHHGLRLQYDILSKSWMFLGVFRFTENMKFRLHYTRLFPDPLCLLFVLQNIAGYKNDLKCG